MRLRPEVGASAADRATWALREQPFSNCTPATRTVTSRDGSVGLSYVAMDRARPGHRQINFFYSCAAGHERVPCSWCLSTVPFASAPGVGSIRCRWRRTRCWRCPGGRPVSVVLAAWPPARSSSITTSSTGTCPMRVRRRADDFTDGGRHRPGPLRRRCDFGPRSARRLGARRALCPAFPHHSHRCARSLLRKPDGRFPPRLARVPARGTGRVASARVSPSEQDITADPPARDYVSSSAGPASTTSARPGRARHELEMTAGHTVTVLVHSSTTCSEPHDQAAQHRHSHPILTSLPHSGATWRPSPGGRPHRIPGKEQMVVDLR